MYRAIVISRPDRPQRLAHFRAQAEAANVKFDVYPAHTPADTKVPKTWKKDPGGGYCGILSHIGALERGVASGPHNHPVLVFEDDALIPIDFNTRFEDLMWSGYPGSGHGQRHPLRRSTEDWEMLHLGGYDEAGKFPLPTGYWPSYRIVGRNWLECYAVRHDSVPALVRALRTLAADASNWASAAFKALQRTMRVEGPFNPFVCQNRSLGSDNWGTATAHDYPNSGLVEGWFTKADGIVYSTECRRIPDGGRMVEIGVHCGRSLSWIMPDALCRNITVHPVDDWVAFGADKYDKLRWYMNKMGVWDKVEPNIRRMKSLEAVKGFEDGSLDLVMIDGDHTYEMVMKDIEAWLPKLKKGGTIMGHDYWSTWHPGVKKAVDQSFKKIEANRLGSGLWVARL